jgi:nucleotide-binding universal stress UspA family protein
MYDARGIMYDRRALADNQEYLDKQAELLRGQGVKVQTKTLVFHDLALGIDEAARIFDADMIACSTHGRGSLGRLVHGGVAWRAVANSTVPVLLRHPEDRSPVRSLFAEPKRLMVPLDGSEYAEKALPLAQQLALEWSAPLWLVRIVPNLPVSAPPYIRTGAIQYDYTKDKQAAQTYLDQIADRLSSEIHTQVHVGGVVDRLMEISAISTAMHVVMASHGRTALSRVILGSVADTLVQRLHCPIIVIPAFASGHLTDHDEVAPADTDLIHA